MHMIKMKFNTRCSVGLDFHTELTKIFEEGNLTVR